MMNMPFTLKELVHRYGFRYGVSIYQSYRCCCFHAHWQEVRRRLAYRLCPELRAMWQDKEQTTVCAQNRSEAALKVLREENARLLNQLQLAQVKNNLTLWDSKLAKLFSSSDEQLRTDAQWGVQQAESGNWEIITSYCSLGGCDLTVIPVRSEREGLLFGALLSALDFKMSRNGACPSCYAEYLQNSI